MDLEWLIFGTMPLDKWIGRLRRARISTLARLADAQMHVGGMKADLIRIDGTLTDYRAYPRCLAASKERGHDLKGSKNRLGRHARRPLASGGRVRHHRGG
jgi:hypothetical protein